MIGKQQYWLSEFRFRLAEFLHFSESAAQAAGITPAQYLLLLHLRGFPGREWGTVGELAERLQASHQGTVALVQRCERNGLVSKRRSRTDARCVEIRLTPRARGLVQRIAKCHAEALATDGRGVPGRQRRGREGRTQHATPQGKHGRTRVGPCTSAIFPAATAC